jgi:putative N-acetylmannosamine-6-phosphate epimerase
VFVLSEEFREDVKLILQHVRTLVRLTTALLRGERQEMATIAELDQAIADQQNALTGLGSTLSGLTDAAAKVSADVTTLLAKVEAGSDVTNEVASLKTATATLTTGTQAIQAAVASLAAADAAANPAPPPPPAPSV